VPAVRWRGGEVRRHNDRLIALSGSVPTRPCADLSWDWRAQPWLALPGGGAIGLLRDPHGGVDLAALPALLSVQMRRGGERLGAGRGRASLKSLLQAHGIAPWQRALVPLIVHRQRIVAVADLWLDRSLQIAASTDAERGRFRWRRSAGYSGAGD